MPEYALTGVGAMVDQMRGLPAGERDLDRPARRARRDRRQDHLDAGTGLAAEAAAHIRRKHAHPRGIDLKRGCDHWASGLKDLQAGPDFQGIARPCRHSRMRLHRQRKMMRRGERFIVLDRRPSDGVVDVAATNVRYQRALGFSLERVDMGRHVEPTRLAVVIDEDKACCFACGLESLGHDDADRLAITGDLGQVARDARIGPAPARSVGRQERVLDDHRDHARRLARFGCVNRRDAAKGDG